MKPTIYIVALGLIVTGALLSSCQTKEQKVEESKQDVKDAKQELNAQYPAFRKYAEEKIEANNKRIAKLKEKLAKPGKAPLDDMRKQRIEDLEKRNAELRSRLYGYENERSDWAAFMRQFNQDMDKLGDAFNDFGNDLKK